VKIKVQDHNNLIWIDLEMTGLYPEKDCIIEIATIITDKNLGIIAIGPSLAIHKEDAILSSMGDWCTKQHGKSGLTERVRQSSISCAQAEQQTLEFIRQYVPSGASPMCGNSIGQDRRFLVNEMPKLEAYFHYRNYDVSAVKEMLKRWSPKAYSGNSQGVPKFEKSGKHLALDDIKDSINEMIHYRTYFFKDLD